MLNLKFYVYINIVIHKARGMNMQIILMLVYIVELCS